MIEISENIPIEVSRELIVKGFHEAARKTKLTQKNIISLVDKAVRTHLGMPEEGYSLVTTLNIHSSNILPRYKVNGCTLLFYKNLPKKYLATRQQFLSIAPSWLVGPKRASEYYLVAHASEKSTHAAVGKMLDAIDLLRGIWNLQANKVMVLSFGERKKPINQVLLGEVHTLHGKDGKNIGDMYWHQSENFQDHRKVDFSNDSYKILEVTNIWRDALKKNIYRKDVELGIVRYVRALDSRDYDSTFIKLWSVLEYLTGTLRDRYDKTIRRASFLYKDREYNRLVLENLRQYRNKSVHLGAGENNIDTHVYQLKSYVEQLLLFHIPNSFGLKSLEEASRFMDLQHDKEALKKQIAFCQAGIKFIGE
ncbi:hypothetical protein KBY85_10640 [Cyanobium sp. BA5m-10]|uniref:hypothetical protein n=1 Tax=Cyanobium sp. BA5m-10 TaxID=2823705 RepID=UPI0020CDD44E|nr:hypothetical protein [Cyanobium sp. BA5m-10]MCP9904588.1 hypothetical protein [Cyanobium sp. BA5m-10]